MGKIKRERQKFHIGATSDGVERDNKPDPIPAEATAAPVTTVDNIFAGIDIKLDKINKFTESAAASKTAPVSQKEQTKSSPYHKIKPNAVVPLLKKPLAAPERQLTKKEKQRLKHDKLLLKLDVTEKAKDKRKKKLAVGSTPAGSLLSSAVELNSLQKKISVSTAKSVPTMQKKKFSTSLKTLEDALPSLSDSLPPLDSILKLRSKNAKTGLDEDKDKIDGGSMVGKKSKNGRTRTFANGKVKAHNKSKPNKSKDLINQFNHYQKLLSDEIYKNNPRAVIALHIKKKLRDRR